MDEKLNRYRQKLEEAINEALTESPPINKVVRRIQNAGYDVFMIVEATVGFNKAHRNGSEQPKVGSGAQPRVRLRLTTQDERFLRQLKISPE